MSARWTLAQITELERLIAAGISQRSAAGLVGHTLDATYSKLYELRKLRRAGKWPPPPKPDDGEPPMTASTPWLPFEIDLMRRLVANGIDYETISERVGHPALSCRSKMSEIRRNPQASEAMAERAAALPAPPKPRKIRNRQTIRAPAAPPPPVDVPFTRTTSTIRYALDAELRGRIATQGVTAGLLGDPLPGRSALDKRNAACGGSKSPGGPR